MKHSSNNLDELHKDRKYSIILIVVGLVLLTIFVIIVIESYYGKNLLFPKFVPGPIPKNMIDLAGTPQTISPDAKDTQLKMELLTGKVNVPINEIKDEEIQKLLNLSDLNGKFEKITKTIPTQEEVIDIINYLKKNNNSDVCLKTLNDFESFIQNPDEDWLLELSTSLLHRSMCDFSNFEKWEKLLDYLDSLNDL